MFKVQKSARCEVGNTRSCSGGGVAVAGDLMGGVAFVYLEEVGLSGSVYRHASAVAHDPSTIENLRHRT